MASRDLDERLLLPCSFGLEVEGRFPPVDPMVVLLNPDDCILLGTRQQSAEEDGKSKIYDALGTERLSGTAIAAKTFIPYSTVMKRLKSLKTDRLTGKRKGSMGLPIAVALGSDQPGERCT